LVKSDERERSFGQGIDDTNVFVDDNSGKAKRGVVQVKSGHVKSGDIFDFGYAARCAERLCFSGLDKYVLRLCRRLGRAA